jgi:hypothetical protein
MLSPSGRIEAVKTMLKVLMAMAFCLLGQTAKAADPGPAPAGVYTLMKISSGKLINLGELEIKGKTYRVGETGAFAAFTQDAAGQITWSAGLDIMPAGWKLGKSIYTGRNPEGQPLIRIHYTSARGAAEVIDCVKE